MTSPSSNTDDDYYDYDEFANYVPKTIDTGPWILIVVLSYSMACVLILPVLITIGKNRQKRLDHRKQMEKRSSTFDPSESSSDSSKEGKEAETKASVDNERVRLNPREEREPASSLHSVKSSSKLKASSEIPSRSVHFDGDMENEDAKRRPRKNTGSAIGGSVISSAFSNMSALSQYSSMTSRSRSHHRGRRNRALKLARLDHKALKAFESQQPQTVKYNSRPLGARKNDVESCHAHGVTAHYSVARSYVPSSFVASAVGDADILPEHAADADDPGKPKIFVDDNYDKREQSICVGANAVCSVNSYKRALDVLVDVAHHDQETKRLMKLGIPMTIAGALESVWDAIAVAIISKYLGVNALQAYIVTNLMIGLSETAIGGVGGAVETLCSHAIGAQNFFLAGQYVQIASLVYFLISLPFFGMWWFLMGDCIRLFGMNEEVVEIGVKYTKVVIFDYLIDGVFGNIYTLLDINGQVTQATLFDFVTGATDCAATWFLLAFVKDIDLFWIGASMLAMSTIHYTCFTLVAHCKGWLDPFYDGMIRNFALKNVPALKNIVRMAVPLTFGYMLEYGEWEALTFFAAVLGPAEVAAWGILESIWDLFEASTYGIASAGSIQLALHLGNGDIGACKRSVGKSLYLSSVLSVLVTAVYFIIGDQFSVLFTDNKTLQNILNATIPIVGIGKVFMNFGMMSWTLVGAQGRYKLSTTISAIMSFFVTLPLSAFSCIYLKLTLDGLVGAIIVGYSTTGLVLSYVLLRSDWEHVVQTIQAENEDCSESDDGDDEEESSSSSSSSEE